MDFHDASLIIPAHRKQRTELDMLVAVQLCEGAHKLISRRRDEVCGRDDADNEFPG